MHTFKDATGRDWVIAVNVDAVKRLRGSELKIDLLAVIEPKDDLLRRLADDPVLLCDVLYVLCAEEAKTRGVSDEDFGRGLAGEAIDRATAALLEEIADFFRDGRRLTLRKVLAKMGEAEAAAGRMAAERIDAIDVDDLTRRAFGDSSTNSPASPASTPES